MSKRYGLLTVQLDCHEIPPIGVTLVQTNKQLQAYEADALTQLRVA
jgi:hypothetical protein